MLNNIVCNGNKFRKFQGIFNIILMPRKKKKKKKYVYYINNFIEVSGSMKSIYPMESFHYTKVLYIVLKKTTTTTKKDSFMQCSLGNQNGSSVELLQNSFGSFNRIVQPKKESYAIN